MKIKVFKQFAIFLKRNLYLLLIICGLFYLISSYLIYSSPEDAVQSIYVRIMYVHVPSAWLGMIIYFFMGIISFIALVWNIRIADILAYSLAPIGMVFTAICIVTGSIWGKPIWNTWWVWDARLTSMLILFFLYTGYIILWSSEIYYSKIAAIVNIIGIINIPIIKFSVEIWSTLHQTSSIFRKSGISMDKAMLLPLLSMFIASSILALILWIINAEAVLNQYKLENHARNLH